MATRQGVNTRSSSKPPGQSAHEDSRSDREDASHSPSCAQPSLQDLQKSIHDLSSSVMNKLDSLMDEVNGISYKLTHLEHNVEFNSNKIADIEQNEIPNLKKSISAETKKLEEKITALEIYNRKQNLLFYGVNETPNEDIFQTLRNTFMFLGLDEAGAQRIMMVNAHRLPRRQTPQDPASRPRSPTPIIARFVTVTDRDRILTLFERKQRDHAHLAGNEGGPRPNPSPRITVRTDLPPALKARRSILAKEAYKLRKERGLSTRILLQGTSIVLQWKQRGTRDPWRNHQE